MTPLADMTVYELRAELRDKDVGDGHRWFGVLDELLRREREAMKQRCAIEVDAVNRELADAWIAEHPADDDDPLTPEWAEPLLEIEDSSHGEWWWSRGVSGFGSVEVRYEAGIDYLKIVVNKAIYYSSLLDNTPPTRGQFRRLCAAFDIPLKETK